MTRLRSATCGKRSRTMGRMFSGAGTTRCGCVFVTLAAGKHVQAATVVDAGSGQCTSSSSGSCTADDEASDEQYGRSWRLRQGGLEMELHRNATGALAWGRVLWRSTHAGAVEDQPPCDELQLGPLFEIALKKKNRLISSKSCMVSSAAPVNASETFFEALLQCSSGINVSWQISLQAVHLPTLDNDSENGDIAGATARIHVTLTGPSKSAPTRLTLLTIESGGRCAKTRLVPTGLVDGSPVLAQNRYFLAFEHPLAKHDTNETTLLRGRLLDAKVDHLRTRVWTGNSFTYSAVIGAFAESSQARRVFMRYLDSARPSTSWRGPLVHYNSWYDFTSWQDEGFFSPRQARNAAEAKMLKELLRELQKDQMNESSAIGVVKTFGEELVKKRDVRFDSFLWDDGWDDPHKGLWAFNSKRFPVGFSQVAQTAKNYSCGLGVWLSPWGGYGEAKETRLKAARAQGFETNQHGLSLAGPKYFQRFKEAATTFRRAAGVNFFKFDGVAGDPAEVSAEMEAMLGIARELHKTGDGDVWINLTTGTWPSPFFLLWVDSIWRGHRDTMLIDEKDLPGATARQRWQAFRECIVYELVAKRAHFFPIARLMIHGVVLAQHGDARSHELHAATDLDWDQEVWSFASMGLLLQELYVSPELMTPRRWDNLATALKWSRQHSNMLEDTRWVFPVGCNDRAWKPHGWAAWRGRLGFLTLRNARALQAQSSAAFSLREALELPAEVIAALKSKEQKQILVVQVEKRLVSPTADGAFISNGKAPCAFLDGARDDGNGRCRLSANRKTHVRLAGGELLVLRIELQFEGQRQEL